MKILFVSRYFYPAFEFGGPIVKMKLLSETLVKKGNYVEVWASNLANIKGKKLNLISNPLNINGIKVFYLPSPFAYRSTPLCPSVLNLCKKRLKLFDVVHLFGVRDSLTTFTAFYSYKYNIPYLVEPMGMLLKMAIEYRSSLKKRIFDIFLLEKILGNSSGIVVTSREEKEGLISMGVPSRKIALRLNPMQIEFTVDGEKQKDERKVKFLYIGRISKRKGLINLVHSASLRMDIIISGPDDKDGTLKELEKAIKKKNLSSTVFIKGPVKEDEKSNLLKESDVVVLPALGGENFGNFAAEAMAFQKPVIVTETCGIASLVKKLNAGIVVPPDRDSLAKAMQTLRDNIDLRRKMGRNGKKIREILAPEKIAMEQEEIYRRIIACGRQATSQKREG